MTGGEYYKAIVEAVRSRDHYFKATRPDGCSFIDPEFRYTVGETATARGFLTGSLLCSAGILHFADVPAETLVGGYWPSCFYEVAPGEIVDSEGQQHGAKSLYVVRELPAWLAFGPNGRVVAQFIAETNHICAVNPTARDAVQNTIEAATRNGLLPVVDATLCPARESGRLAARNTSWYSAWWAARFAARALVVADLIVPKHLATLYAPFAEVLPLEELRERAIAAFPLTVQP